MRELKIAIYVIYSIVVLCTGIDFIRFVKRIDKEFPKEENGETILDEVTSKQFKRKGFLFFGSMLLMWIWQIIEFILALID